MTHQKFRIYEHDTGEMLVPESVAMTGEGEFIDLGSKTDHECGEIYSVYWFSDPDEFDVSWYTGWEDRNGQEVFGGDFIERVRDESAEAERKWLKENEDSPEVDDIESFVHDYSGAVGLVKRTEGGWVIENLEGHKWAFHGPEGTMDFSWETEIEVVGNKWQNKTKVYQNGTV